MLLATFLTSSVNVWAATIVGGAFLSIFAIVVAAVIFISLRDLWKDNRDEFITGIMTILCVACVGWILATLVWVDVSGKSFKDILFPNKPIPQHTQLEK